MLSCNLKNNDRTEQSELQPCISQPWLLTGAALEQGYALQIGANEAKHAAGCRMGVRVLSESKHSAAK
jgi:hypothetical protein